MKALVLNRAALILSFAGIFVSGCLSIGQFYALALPCGTSLGCDKVSRHSSSHALGIPNAYLGLAFYIVLTAMIFWRVAAPGNERKGLVISYLLCAMGTLASLVLTYISFAIIQATCLWCLSSAVIVLALLIVHAFLMQLDPEPQREPEMASGILAAALVLTTVVMLGAMWSKILHGAQPNVTVGLPMSIYMPPDAHTFGDPNAPVTIVEFGDLVCPSCRVEYGKIKDFVNAHSGKVKYVFRHFPLVDAEGHEQAAPAAVVAEIAAEKGQFWPFVDAMYSSDGENSRDFGKILDVAQKLGLDPKTTTERVRNQNDPAFKRMMRDLTEAGAIGVKGTPTFFLISKGYAGVRATSMFDIFDDLDRPEYKKYYGSG